MTLLRLAGDLESCVAVANDSVGAQASGLLREQFPAVAKRERALNEALISRDERDRIIPTHEQIEPQLMGLVQNVTRKHGTDVNIINKTILQKSEHINYCNVAVSFYEEIKRLPREQKVALVRYLYDQS
jgi:hypothetical protein